MPEIVKCEIHQEGRIRLCTFLSTFFLVGRPGPGDGPTLGNGNGMRSDPPYLPVDPSWKIGQDF
jgi:hypothetical protein